jgi:ADP-heptose:LPS heptosyltransferase
MIPNPRQGKTLVLCPIGLGNFIMATPALKALSDAVGKDRVSLLALKSGIGDMARASNLFGRVFEWDPDGEGLGKGISLLREVRAEKFTHSVALFPASHWKFTAFHRLAGSAFRMGFAYPNQKAPEWIQHISLPLTDTHDTLQNLKLVETFLGTAIQNATDPFFPSDVKSPERLPSMPFFACHPGSSAERGMDAKRLPPEVFAKMIAHVHRETGWPCVLVGGPEEKDLRKAVAAGCRDAIMEVPIRSLAETAGTLRFAKFFLGNDSGLMHLSDAVGTRCAAYFGPTDEKRTGPYGYWEMRNGASRHLVLRRKNTIPIWTLKTVGSNPPLKAGDETHWNLEELEAWEALRSWIQAL